MYLNLTQLAESFGVSEHVVTEWVRKEDMPHVHDRDRILFEKGPVLAWAARKGLAANAGFLAQSAPPLTPAVRGMLMHRISSPDGLTAAPTGQGFALPHPASGVFLGKACALVALIQLNAPWGWAEPPDGIPVTRLLFFISPTPRQHVNMLGLLARGISSGFLEQALSEGRDDDALIQALVSGSGLQPTPRKDGSR